MFTNFEIKEEEIFSIIKVLEEKYHVFAPHAIANNYFYTKEMEKEKMALITKYRAVESTKVFFLPSKEDLSSLEEKPKAILNLKACDLSAFKVLDYVFQEGDFRDPYYCWRRENYFIFSSDCTDCKDVCFCTSLGYKPYPENGFDLNLVEVDGNYILQVASEKAKAILDDSRLDLKEAGEELIEVLNKNRQAIYQKVKSHAENYLPADLKDSLRSAVEEGFSSEIWEREAEKCVECGGCNHCCPACHCFFLSQKKDGLDKLRNWDSCLYRTYALVAGGANPRKKLAERLRNRFLKKFVFFPEVISEFGCTGCGRCIEVCLAKIDIREVLKELVLTKGATKG